jgi:2-dehydro-3-deoxyglucarate aldolase
VLIGPYDLSSSMNILGQLTHPKMEEAISIIMKACIENGVMPGIHIVQPDSNQVKQRISQGYQFIAYSVDITMISTMANKLFDELNAKTI